MNHSKTVYIIDIEVGSKCPVGVVATYNCSEKDLPFKIMRDPIYGVAGEDCLFHYLLQHRLTKLEGDIFKNVLAAIQKKPDFCEWSDDFTVKPILIECLYTKILTPEDLLKDIEVAGDMYGRNTHHICWGKEGVFDYLCESSGVIYLPKKKCVLCNKKFDGHGNNPDPLAKKGLCCKECNYDVIEARVHSTMMHGDYSNGKSSMMKTAFGDKKE